MTEDEARVIATAFDSSLKSGDQTLIEGFTKVQINMALSVLPRRDRGKLWYKAMEKRIKELDKIESQQKERREKSRSRWFDFLLNSFGGHIVTFIWTVLIGGAAYVGGYYTKANSVKIASDNPNIKVYIDNRQYQNFSVANLAVTQGGRAVLTATAQDAVTGDTIKFAVDGKIDYITDENGNIITDENGEPIIADTGAVHAKETMK